MSIVIDDETQLLSNKLVPKLFELPFFDNDKNCFSQFQADVFQDHFSIKLLVSL